MRSETDTNRCIYIVISTASGQEHLGAWLLNWENRFTIYSFLGTQVQNESVRVKSSMCGSSTVGVRSGVQDSAASSKH